MILPPELLSEIFLCYKHLLDPFSAPQSLLLLGSISHYIRHTAWSIPQLWSHISLILSQDPSHREAQVAGLVSWLSRSGESPLHIRLECAPSSSTPDQHWANNPPTSAVDAILPHCARWEEMYLMLPYASYVRIFQQTRRQMPMLRQLTLVSRKNWSTTTSSSVPILMASAPALKEVNLTSLPSSRPFDIQTLLPWSQLTRFKGYHLRLADALDALRRAASLESCTLTSALGYPPLLIGSSVIANVGDDTAAIAEYTTPPPPLVLHETLTELTLDGNTTALKYLTLPALEKLRITMNRAFAAQHCVQLLRRSSSCCRLTELDIAVNFISAMDLIECLEAAPALRVLKVLNRNDRIHSVFGDEVVERLTSSSVVVVPHLTTLEVLECCCQFRIEKLGAMLWSRRSRSRWDQQEQGEESSPLRRFWLETKCAPAFMAERIIRLPEVQKVVELGMVIDVV